MDREKILIPGSIHAYITVLLLVTVSWYMYWLELSKMEELFFCACIGG